MRPLPDLRGAVMGRRAVLLVLLLLLCAGCGAEKVPEPKEKPEKPPEMELAEPAPAAPEPPEEEPPAEEAGDRVLLTLKASLDDGRELTLEAVGKTLDEYNCGVREVRVYAGETLVQTVLALEAIELEWGSAVDQIGSYGYTSCWSPEEVMTVLDLNFDGNPDFGLFGWTTNNTIPYYYWIWDKEAEQYRFTGTMQGVEVHLETQEVTAGQKTGSGGREYTKFYYQPDASGNLLMTRYEVQNFAQNPYTENPDYERPVVETWTVREGAQVRPGPFSYQQDDVALTRREVPVLESGGDGSVFRFTEIWELRDGGLQWVRREPYEP